LIRFILIILSVLLSVYCCDGMPVNKISFKLAKPSEKLNLFNSPPNEYSPDSTHIDSLKVVQHFQSQGWLDCEAKVTTHINKNKVDISYSVIKNQIYRLSIICDLVLPGDESPGYLDDVILPYHDQPADEKTIDRAIREALANLSENSYPYAEIRIKSLTKNSDSKLLNLTLDINPGPAVVINRVIFEGVRNLISEFLITYTNLHPPFAYDQNRIDYAGKRLSTAVFAEQTGNSYLRYSQYPENGILVIPIKESPSVIIDGALGYSSNENSFYGRIEIQLSNMFGSGRQALVGWSKKDKYSSNINFGYLEVCPFDLPLQANFKIYQNDRDSLYIETGGNSGISFLFSDRYQYSVVAGISQITPERYGALLIPKKDKMFVEAGFTANTKDHNLNPKSGELFSLAAAIARENNHQDSLFSSNDKSYRTVRFVAEKFIQISRTSVIALLTKGSSDFTLDIPPDRQFAIGGFSSLRGFFQDQFYVSRYVIGSLEYRLLTSSTGRAYIFTDMAIFQQGGSDVSDSDTIYKSGSGIGITTAVRTGTAALELAVPHDTGFSDTKIHFGLRAGF